MGDPNVHSSPPRIIQSFIPLTQLFEIPTRRPFLIRRHIEIFRKPTTRQFNSHFLLLLLPMRSPTPTIPQNRRHHQSRPTHTRHIRTTRGKRRQKLFRILSIIRKTDSSSSSPTTPSTRLTS